MFVCVAFLSVSRQINKLAAWFGVLCIKHCTVDLDVHDGDAEIHPFEQALTWGVWHRGVFIECCHRLFSNPMN